MILLDLYNSSHPTQPSFNNCQLADNRKTRRFLAKENWTMEKKKYRSIVQSVAQVTQVTFQQTFFSWE